MRKCRAICYVHCDFVTCLLCAQALHRTHSVCNVRATSKVCNAMCARCALCKCRAIRCAQCVLVTSLLCAQALHRTHAVCNVHTTFKVCNATCARSALCKCRAIRCVLNVSVPRLLRTQTLLSAQYPDSVQCVCSKQGGHCSVCSVCIVQMSCVFCCVQGVSVPRLPCAQTVYSAPSLCNVCVHTL